MKSNICNEILFGNDEEKYSQLGPKRGRAVG